MIKRHFLRFYTWYVITLFILGALATWCFFSNRVSEINEMIESRTEQKQQ